MTFDQTGRMPLPIVLTKEQEKVTNWRKLQARPLPDAFNTNMILEHARQEMALLGFVLEPTFLKMGANRHFTGHYAFEEIMPVDMVTGDYGETPMYPFHDQMSVLEGHDQMPSRLYVVTDAGHDIMDKH